MIQNIKTLFLLLAIFTIAFFVLKKLLKGSLSPELFNSFKSAWYQITLSAFLSINFWMFAFLATICIHKLKKYIKNKEALFLFLLFVIPTAGVSIKGFAGINYFIVFNFPMLLSLCLLLPASFKIYTSRNTRGYQPMLFVEKVFYLLMILNVILTYRMVTMTVGLRSIFILLIEVILPFYVFSNLQHSKQTLKEVLIAFLMAMILLSFVSFVESLKHWSFYNVLTNSLGFENANEFSISRDGMLRSVGTSQQPIVLGLMIAVGFGIFMAVKNTFFENKMMQHITLLVLLFGLVTPFSRGPWVGAFLMILILALLGKSAFMNALKILVGVIAILMILSVFESGRKVLNMLPIIGKTEVETVDYRSRLVDSALLVVERNPLFGSADYNEQPEMEAMRQGQGIIDITNTYLQILLDSGYVGLILFLILIVGIVIMLFKAIKQNNDIETVAIGKGLLAVVIGMAFMIAGVSSISFVPWIYWIFFAISVSFIKMVSIDKRHH